MKKRSTSSKRAAKRKILAIHFNLSWHILISYKWWRLVASVVVAIASRWYFRL